MWGLFGREPASCSVTNTTWSGPQPAHELRFFLDAETEVAEHFSQRGSFCLVREEMRWGWGGGGRGAHLRKWLCTAMSRPQAVTCKSSIMCIIHRRGFRRQRLFALGQAQFDKHLSLKLGRFLLSRPKTLNSLRCRSATRPLTSFV